MTIKSRNEHQLKLHREQMKRWRAKRAQIGICECGSMVAIKANGDPAKSCDPCMKRDRERKRKSSKGQRIQGSS